MGKALNITGQRFGKILVLNRVENDKNNKSQWLCQCDCGTQKIIRGSDLSQGKIISCGCENKRIVKEMNEKRKELQKIGYYKNLKGQKFGKLTVLEFDEEFTRIKRAETSSQYAYWKCKCDCGNIKSYASVRLNNGTAISCGCARKETNASRMQEFSKQGAKARLIDLTGLTYGKLTVLSRSPNQRNNRPAWICKCSCGNITEVSGESLKRGYTQSCGCLGNSKGQDKIKEILSKNNINFLQEVKFNDLKDKSYLRFDFAILNSQNQIIKLIEFDGRQHSDPTSIWYTETVIKHDQMKNDYCQKKNIPLLRIPYTEIDNITLELLLQ